MPIYMPDDAIHERMHKIWLEDQQLKRKYWLEEQQLKREVIQFYLTHLKPIFDQIPADYAYDFGVAIVEKDTPGTIYINFRHLGDDNEMIFFGKDLVSPRKTSALDYGYSWTKKYTRENVVLLQKKYKALKQLAAVIKKGPQDIRRSSSTGFRWPSWPW